jgi:Putative restriction endonuclease
VARGSKPATRSYTDTGEHRLFVIGVGNRAIVSPQNPVVIAPLSEPEPDVVLLRQRPVPYIAAHPTETDVLLVIEVADTLLG